MTVTAAQLRMKMASLSGDELRAVEGAPDGEYIAEAREAATRELALRAGSTVPARSSESSSLKIADADRATYVVEDAVWSVWDSITNVWRSLPRKELPHGLRALFWIGVWASVTLATSVASAFRRGGTDLEAAFGEVIGVGWHHPYITVLGIVGVLLAYGICTQRAYPRWLAIAVVVLMSAETLFEQLRHAQFSSDLYFVPVAAWATIKYLLRSDEVNDYYFQVRHGVSRELAELKREGSLVAQGG